MANNEIVKIVSDFGICLEPKNWNMWVAISEDIEVMIKATDPQGVIWIRKRVTE